MIDQLSQQVTDFILRLRLAYRLIRDERVSLPVKAIPLLVLLYVLSPVDLIPDIPVIGWFDDVALVVGGLQLFESLIPDYIVYEHRVALGMVEGVEPTVIVEEEKPKNV
ncbi:MAG: YkvA family protein [Phototrophicaceae bacterium]|jgi:uncharacterized membrane protein YkvA (DUF1232 family)